jgi:hypothetical protein
MSNLRRDLLGLIFASRSISISLARGPLQIQLLSSHSMTLDSNSFIERWWWWCYKWGSIVAFSKSHDIMRRRQQKKRERNWMLCCTFLLRKVNYSLLYFFSYWIWMEKCSTLESLLAGITRKGIYQFWVHLLIITSRRCHVEFLAYQRVRKLQCSPFTVKCCVLWMHKAKNFISYHFSTLYFFRFASMSSELLSKRSFYCECIECAEA